MSTQDPWAPFPRECGEGAQAKDSPQRPGPRGHLTLLHTQKGGQQHGQEDLHSGRGRLPSGSRDAEKALCSRETRLVGGGPWLAPEARRPTRSFEQWGEDTGSLCFVLTSPHSGQTPSSRDPSSSRGL